MRGRRDFLRGIGMKIFLISLAIWIAVAWLPQFIASAVLSIARRIKKKRAGEEDEWEYEVL
jgi:hypothetical protein